MDWANPESWGGGGCGLKKQRIFAELAMGIGNVGLGGEFI